MNKLFDFLDQHKFGVLTALAVYTGLFIFFQLETYKKENDLSAGTDQVKLKLVDEIEIKPENLEISGQNGMDNLKSISQNAQDSREKSTENWSPNKTAKQIEEEVRNLEKSFYSEAGGEEKRNKILEESKRNKQNQSLKSTAKTTTSAPGSDKAYAGNVMVEWTLANREPHQNNAWYVRNPGYTCGAGSSGKVSIKIKVDQSGNVLSAVYAPEQSYSANTCMIEQAKKYAMMSRFSYSGSAPKNQEGLINYLFISQ